MKVLCYRLNFFRGEVLTIIFNLKKLFLQCQEIRGQFHQHVYVQLLLAKILKAQKYCHGISLFGSFGICACIKSACKMLVKSTTEVITEGSWISPDSVSQVEAENVHVSLWHVVSDEDLHEVYCTSSISGFVVSSIWQKYSIRH